MTTAVDRGHLSIGEVLGLLQQEFPEITISKIRFLESQGLIDPERTPSGYRKFYDDDIARLRWILQQQRENFLPLKVIRDRLDESGGDPVPAAVTPTGAAAAAERSPEPEPAAAAAAVLEAPRATAPTRSALAEALERRAIERLESTPLPLGVGSVLDPGPTEASFTAEELAAAAGLSMVELEQLESFGLVAGRAMGRETVYDAEALVVGRLAGGFLRNGLEIRHLRMFKMAADREAGVYEQLVRPLVRQRDADSRARAGNRLSELAGLGQDLRAALLRQALKHVTG